MKQLALPLLLVLLLAMLCGVSCKDGKNKKTTEKEPVVHGFEQKQAQMDSAWTSMIVSDENKFANMDRVVAELKLIEGSNEAILTDLQKNIDSVRQSRYTRTSMASSSQIDAYDLGTNQVLAAVRKQVTENPNANKYQIINQLVSEIQLADDSVLLYRKSYDKAIDDYRQFLVANRKALKKGIPAFDSLPNYSYFRLVQ